ncbi:hypothetical protein [Kitasatospora aureofaciens]|uniref:hypothetical protein n=1 Tax=Kitasatospora aureofaciens TaxID=1894 RepID=UPI00381EDC95
MAVPQVLPHIDAVTAALTGAQLTVYLGGAPQSVAPPYAVLYPSPGAPVRASLADDRVNYQAVVQITCVGATAEQALNVCDRARAALDGPLAVAGRTAWRPEALDGQPVQRDDDVTPPVYYSAARWRLRSTPS